MSRHPCTLIVRGSDGLPLAGIRFVVEQAQEPVPEMGYVTGPDGQAHVGLPAGEATIRFFLPQGRSQKSVLDIDPQSAHPYSVTLAT